MRYLQSFLISFVCLLSYSPIPSAAYEDLEQTPNKFVLQTKRIIISGHPFAFNASIVRWNGALVMSFREIVNPSSTHFSGVHCAAESQIGLVWLDDDFNQIGEVQILDLGSLSSPSRAEDPRLLTVAGELYLSYSDNLAFIASEGGFRMHLAVLDFDGKHFFIKHQERLSNFEGEFPWRREKNWVPFEYEGNLLMAYGLSPHRIFYPRKGMGSCETVAVSYPQISWKYGELRGGTPAILIDNQYVAIFHSCMDLATIHSDEKTALHYFIGAYTFAKEPPFEITQISPKPIIARGFYSGETYIPYWKPVRVVFPCGLLVDGPFFVDHLWTSRS